MVRNYSPASNTTSYAKNAYDDLILYALSISDACEHRNVTQQIIPKTCIDDGYTLYTCSDCGLQYKGNFDNATGHQLGDWVIVQEATATQTGLKQKICSICNEVVYTEIIPIAGAPIAYINTPSDVVLLGDEVTFTVSIENSDPLKSLALVPSFDTDIFDYISARWLINATLQSIDANTLRAVSAWSSARDVNTNIYEFTLRSKSLTPVTMVDSTVLIGEVDGTIELTVIPANLAVVDCLHENIEYVAINELYHGCVCTNCNHTVVEEHIFDNPCDNTCNSCGYVRPVDHSFDGEWIHDVFNHWKICTTCGETVLLDEHFYDSDTDTRCNVCDYIRFIRGDVDGDGTLTSDDAIYLLYHFFFGDAEYPVNQPLDFNGDGFENPDDAIYLLYHSLDPESYPI
ncbi:MAG: hypothetical protein Q4F99_07270 [bacterium]|nr:hypothetical protein [bacterium]